MIRKEELYNYMVQTMILSQRSYANRFKNGSIIVKDKKIISTGYNGTPSGWTHQCEDENNKTYDYVLHAESNAIAKLAASGGEGSKGATLFTIASPCVHCAKLIIQSGITEVFSLYLYRDPKGIEYLEKSNIYFEMLDIDKCTSLLRQTQRYFQTRNYEDFIDSSSWVKG